MKNRIALTPAFPQHAPMLARVLCAAVNGIEAFPFEVDLNCGCGDTVIVIVGLPDTAVKESRDRVRTALGNSGFKVPMGRSTINLAPADVKKEGPSFDLPIDKMKTKIHEFAGGESQVGSNYPKPDASNFLNGISARAKTV